MARPTLTLVSDLHGVMPVLISRRPEGVAVLRIGSHLRRGRDRRRVTDDRAPLRRDHAPRLLVSTVLVGLVFLVILAVFFWTIDPCAQGPA